MRKKIFILVPDGVSLRNFAYSSFYNLGIEKGYDVIFWNNTPFDFEELGFPYINIENPKPHFLTDILKSARIRIELKLFAERDKDEIYKKYLFPLSFRSIKACIKSCLIQFYCTLYGSEKGIDKIRSKMFQQERKTSYYQRCKEVLKREKPDLIFCTSQRSVTSIAPLTAAKDLEIPTVSFIFSWDNLPKATTVITTDYYCVWSDLMRDELLHYNRYIKLKQVFVTGTPQFEPHYDENLRESRNEFFETYNLDIKKKYICFSGDDITTSPKDELYLRDLAKGVKKLNEGGQDLGIIFRRCPVDFSSRYNEVLSEYKDIIAPIHPAWERIGTTWNTVLPTKKDLYLQVNIIAHSEFVVNLGSSMVFDFATQNKVCAFMNYNYLNETNTFSRGVYVYDFVHFRSMPSKNAVYWINKPNEIANAIELLLINQATIINESQKWFKIINKQPADNASNRIWKQIDLLITNTKH